MNKMMIALGIIWCLLTGIAYADLVTVTLRWTMTDTTGVEGYRMYYSYNSDMSGKMLHSDCEQPSRADGQFVMVCRNVNIDPNRLPVYFQVEAYNSTKAAASSPKEEALLPVKDFSMSIK